MTKPMNRRGALRLGAATALATMVAGDPSSFAGTIPPPRGASTAGSRLDPRDLQVLFADLQVPLVAGSTTVSPASLSRSAAVLARVAATLAIPTLFSTVPEGGGPPRLVPELRPFATDANTILRTPISPFHHPPTVAALAWSGRGTLASGPARRRRPFSAWPRGWCRTSSVRRGPRPSRPFGRCCDASRSPPPVSDPPRLGTCRTARDVRVDIARR